MVSVLRYHDRAEMSYHNGAVVIKSHINMLSLSTCLDLLPDLSPKSVHEISLSSGFELGILTCINDDAYTKATGRKRNMIVYTTPQEQALVQTLK